MMLVVYESLYGFTRRYAEWIAQALGCPCRTRTEVKPDELRQADTILYGGGLYAGGMSGLKQMAKTFAALPDKNLILFTCGLADPADEQNRQAVRSKIADALSPALLERITLFHLRGGIDYSRLSLVHRAMMGMLKRMLLRKPESERGEGDRQLLASYGQAVDFTDRDSIHPLVAFAQAL